MPHHVQSVTGYHGSGGTPHVPVSHGVSMTDHTHADDRDEPTERHRRNTVTAQGVFTRGPPCDSAESDEDCTEADSGANGAETRTSDRDAGTGRVSAQGAFDRGGALFSR